MEKAYFGMDYLRVTNGPHGNKSHKNSWAHDYGGKDTGIDNFYAPFTGIVRRIRSHSNELWFESAEPVQWADGTQDYATIMLIHSNSVPVSDGQTVAQGALLYSEGTKGNATGNHIHFEVGRGKFVSPYGWYANGYGDDGSEIWNIYNQVDPTKVFFLKSSTVVLDPGTDNTSGAKLQWVVDDGTVSGNLDKNTYFTVGVGNMEYFSSTDVNTNLGYLENDKTYLAYDSYVGSDYTWWRFRHPDGNLYWTAMIWDRCSSYGTLEETAVSGKTIVANGDVQLYQYPDPFNPADAVLTTEDRVPLKSQLNISIYDDNWYSVQYNSSVYWVKASSNISIVDSSWEDYMSPLPAGSSLEIIADGVWYYSEPNPGKYVAQLNTGTTLVATRQSSTGIMNYNWYEAMLEDGTLVYIVINNTQVTLTKGTEGGTVVPPSGGDDYSTNVYGIDVSKYQGDINWDSVKNDTQNISFCFIRAVSTRDANSPYVDEYLIKNMQGCQRVGIPYGIYIFTYGDNTAEIDAEVDLAVSQLNGYNLTYPIAWDFEADNFKDTSKKASNTELILYALRRIQNYGYLPILYTYYNMIKNYCDWETILANGFDIWIADYRGYNGFVQEGGKATIWQYSSSGSVGGISGRCDMDISYFDYHRYITDGGYNGGATQYPTVSYGGYLTITASNAEAFPYPSVNAEGNYYLINGASYSVVGKCEDEIEGYTWYLIKDNAVTRYVPFIADRMTLVTGSFITSNYRFSKTTTKTWLCAYENMELFSDTDVYASMGYLTRNVPYEVFGFLMDPINSNGTDFMFVILKTSTGYAYCVDFSKDNKCYIYESDIPYPVDPVEGGNKLTTSLEWTGLYPIPSTYDTEPDAFMEIGKLYDLVGKTRYNFDNKSWFVVTYNGKTYYVLDDGRSSVTTDKFNIPYQFTKYTTTTNLEVCATAYSHTSCSDDSAGTLLDTDKVYTLYGKINDTSVTGEWYVMMGEESPLYIKVENGNCLVYEGTPYQRTACEDILIIPNEVLTYYDYPTTSPSVSKEIGTLDAGVILKPKAKINRAMIGGVFYEIDVAGVPRYVVPESVQSFVGTLDLSYEPSEVGYYLQTVNSIDARLCPHSYAAADIHVPANTRLYNPLKMSKSADGNEWWAIPISDSAYAYIIKDENVTYGYEYTTESVGRNFYCSSETANIVIYDHCDTNPDNILRIVEAPANILLSAKVTNFTYPWYTTILDDGKTGYIFGNDTYVFDYSYVIYQLDDYAFARVAQDTIVYERPDETSPQVKTISAGDYATEFMVGGDGTVGGTWLMLGDDQFVQTGTNVTLVYVYPQNVVSKYLVINVTGKDGLPAYTLATTTSSFTTIPYGTQIKPTSTFEANGKTWYAVSYNNGTYYIDVDDPNFTTADVYEQTPVTEGFCAHVLEDNVKCYSRPSATQGEDDKEYILSKDKYYPISSKLVDEIDGFYWYSLIIEGETYYMETSKAGVEFAYHYDADPIDRGWFLQPLIEGYLISDNPVDPEETVTIDLDTSLEIEARLTTVYNGMTWYMVYYNDKYMYAPVNSDGTNARIYNLEDQTNSTELKAIKESMEIQRECISKIQEAMETQAQLNSVIGRLFGTWGDSLDVTIDNLDKLITKLDENQEI